MHYIENNLKPGQESMDPSQIITVDNIIPFLEFQHCSFFFLNKSSLTPLFHMHCQFDITSHDQRCPSRHVNLFLPLIFLSLISVPDHVSYPYNHLLMEIQRFISGALPDKLFTFPRANFLLSLLPLISHKTTFYFTAKMCPLQ